MARMSGKDGVIAFQIGNLVSSDIGISRCWR